MPNQGLIRFQKLKAASLHRIQAHNERKPEQPTSHSNPDIVPALTPCNIVWTRSADSLLQRCKARIDEIDEERKAAGARRQRHSADKTVCVEAVVSMAAVMQRIRAAANIPPDAPPETRRVMEDVIRRRQYEVLDEARKLLDEKFGAENCVSWAIHFDEAGEPHLHYDFVPAAPDKSGIPSVAASALLTPMSLVRLQREFYEQLFKKHGLDRYDSAYAVKDGVVKRVRKSKRHLNTPEYKDAMRALKETKQKLTAARTELSTVYETRKRVDAELTDKRRRIAECEAEIEAINCDIEDATKARRNYHAWRQRQDQRDAEIAQREAQAAAREQQVAKRDAAIIAADAKYSELKARFPEMQAYIADIQARREQTQPQASGGMVEDKHRAAAPSGAAKVEDEHTPTPPAA